MHMLRGLGPKSLALLAEAGITSAEQLRAADALQLFLQLKGRSSGVTLNMLYALIGAQENRDWREIARERRTELLLRLEELGHAPR
jgi:DNA transformation protein